MLDSNIFMNHLFFLILNFLLFKHFMAKIWTNRYFTFFILMILPFIYLYIYDWPQALSTRLQQYPYYYSLRKVNLFYTFTAIGNILLIFKLGNVFDKVKLKVTCTLVTLILMLTQLATTLLFKFYHDWSYYIITGIRVIFGIAGECTYLIQAIACTKVYTSQAGIYIGYGNAISFLGSSLNSLLTPIFANIFNDLFFPSLISFIFTVIFCIIGLITIKIIHQHQRKQQQKLLFQNQFLNVDEKQKNPDDLIIQLKQFPKQFWFLLLLIFIESAAFFGFNSVGIDYLVKRYNIQYQTAGSLFLIPICTGTLSAFIFWNKIKISLRMAYNLTSFILFISHLAFYFLPNIPENQIPSKFDYVAYCVFLFVLGINQGGYVMKYLASVYKVTKPQNSGAVTGMTTIAIHLSNLCIPLISSVIVTQYSDKKIGYKNMTLILFLPLSTIGLIITIYMRLSTQYSHLDTFSNQLLQKSFKHSKISRLTL